MDKPASYPPSGPFTTKAVSQATGLSVETLRAWERRYEVVQPCRDAGGRRSYTAADVGRLRLLRTATELGHTISRLAKLDADALAELIADFEHNETRVGLPNICKYKVAVLTNTAEAFAFTWM